MNNGREKNNYASTIKLAQSQMRYREQTQTTDGWKEQAPALFLFSLARGNRQEQSIKMDMQNIQAQPCCPISGVPRGF